jgi:sugar phosphate isomerase/epimerase
MLHCGHLSLCTIPAYSIVAARRPTRVSDSLKQMRSGISTHVFLPQRLTPTLLDALRASGVGQIEVFASRHHIDYTDRGAVRELANWFRSNDVIASLHMPLFSVDDEASWSKHTAASLNLIHAAKAERIAAMDEVKRALEMAEQVPLTSMVLHLGLNEEHWDTRALDDALTAVEHLKAFAGPLGVKLLLENLNNDVATPEHLVEIVRVGHFDSVGFCLDLGHAHLAEAIPESSHAPAQSGVAQAFAAFGDKLSELHVHDNHGVRDEHLWPGEGSIDFPEVDALIGAMKNKPVGVLEIAHELGYETAGVTKRAAKAAEIMAGL